MTPPDGTTTDVEDARPSPGETRLGVMHTGRRYVYGFGPDFYGVWDEHAPGSPVERFPATVEGRQAGWDRYVEMEPSAKEVEPKSVGVVSGEDEVVETRRGPGRWVLLALVILVVGGVIVARSSGGKKAVTGGGGPLTTGKTAHVDISGGQTVSEDLDLSKFTAQGLDSLYGKLNATWSGATTEMTLTLSQPRLGVLQTTQIGNQRLIFQVTPAGAAAPLVYSSSHGECTITLTTVDPTGVAGSYECTAIPAQGGTDVIDAKGSFEGSS